MHYGKKAFSNNGQPTILVKRSGVCSVEFLISHRHSPPQRLLLGFQLKKNGKRAGKCSFHFALSAARVLFLPFQSSYVTKRPPRRRVSHRGNLKAHPRMTKPKKVKEMQLKLRRRPPSFIEYHVPFIRHVAPCPGCSLTYNEAKF